jgi:hypothetical protein
MKSLDIQPNVNWHTVEPVYGADDFLKIENEDINTKDGIQLNLSYFLKNITDLKTNNYTQTVLTDNIRMDNIFTPDIPTNTEYPNQFTSYLMSNGFPYKTGKTCYLKVIESETDHNGRWFVMGNQFLENESPIGDISYPDTTTRVEYESRPNKVDANDDNGIYFSITLLSDDELTIMHDDNYADVYLTSRGDPIQGTDQIFFATTQESTQEERTFKYIYNPDTGFLALYKIFNTQTTWTDSSGNTQTANIPYTYYLKSVFKRRRNDPDTNWGYALFEYQIAQSGNLPIPREAIFRTIPFNKNTRDLKINNHWFSYSTFGEQNNLKVNQDKSFKNIFNNFLFSIPYKTITEKTGEYNVLQLKNQLTPSYDQSRANPFPNYRGCDHREYDKIFTGTNQIKGSDQLSLGYNSYVTTINLKPDEITYFNAPQDMYPTKRINVNDSGLIEAGAIGGDTPIVSDKLFKKAADYKYNTPYGAPSDEESGVWLCTWLKANIGTDWDERVKYSENLVVNYKNKTYRARNDNQDKQPDINNLDWESIPGGDPVWVDRYYNPKSYSAQEALEVTGQYYDYTSKFEYVIQKFHAQDEYVFDKRSDITFEPGCLYAYYRIGPKENQSIIDTESQQLVHEGVEPIYYQDRDRYANIETYVDLTGDVYVETNALNKTTNSDFTVSLNINTDDWTQPISSQIIGNYTNQGFGVFNKLNITPYSVFSNDQAINILNTDLEPVLTITPTVADPTLNLQVIKTIHGEGNENLHALIKLSKHTGDKVKYQGSVYECIGKHTSTSGNTPVNDDGTTNSDYWNLIETEDPDILFWGVGVEYAPVGAIMYYVYQYDTKGMLVERFLTPDIPTTMSISDITLDINCYYILYSDKTVRKFDVNTEREDLLYQYKQWPPVVVGSSASLDPNPDREYYHETPTTYIELYDQNQYRINCELYTIDMTGDVWFSKNNTIYKSFTNKEDGVNSSYTQMFGGRQVSLVSEESLYGETQGNQITLTGDGISNVEGLMSRWNEANTSNRVTSLNEAGLEVIPPTGEEIQLQGGADKGSDTTIYALSASGMYDITSLKSDTKNNIWVLTRQTPSDTTKQGMVLYNMDSDRRIINTIKLSDLHEGIVDNDISNSCMDIVYEFVRGVKREYIAVLLQDTSDLTSVKVVKINLDGTLLSCNDVVLGFLDRDISTYKNIFNSETVRRLHPPEIITGSYLTYKFRYQSYFDTDKTYVKYMYYDISKLTRGAHHFAFSFNSVNGNLSFLVDGELQIAQVSDDVFTGAAYKYTKTIHNPLHVGSDSFFNNITLSEYLKQQNYYFVSGCRVDNIRVYNKYLNFHKIRALTRENKTVQTVKLTLPTGKRTYVDQVVKYYLNRKPGRKSNYFDINVVSDTITDPDVRSTVELSLRQEMEDKLPANTYLNNINWTT